eukprot:scaffold155665_cov40-Attheya_sp.AAC.1
MKEAGAPKTWVISEISPGASVRDATVTDDVTEGKGNVGVDWREIESTSVRNNLFNKATPAGTNVSTSS